MKFTNGQWLLQPGIEIFAPKEIYFEKYINNTLILTTPTQHIKHRGDTLGGIVLTVEISSPQPDVIRVKTFHHKGQFDKGPNFELNADPKPLDYISNENEIIIKSGNLKLILDKKNWQMKYYRNETLLTVSQGRDFGYVKKDWKGFAYDVPTRENSFMQQSLRMNVGELIYGLGERFTPFTKNGQTVEMWQEDGGTSTEQSYKNIPFYTSNKGYGVFVNSPDKVSFEIGSENVKKVQFSVSGESLDYFFIDGPELKDVLNKYTDITGKPTLPKPWTYGLWLSTSFTTSYDEKTVMSFINGMIERKIPLKTFHFDCFWMKDFHWTDLTWDERVFSDPKGMLKRIKALGLNICVWINPYIAQESYMFDEGMKNGYLVKKENGDVWQWDMWQPGMALVDFTNPDATRWFKNKLATLVDMGVDSFKTDFGERIPTDIKYHDGSDTQKMHNYYVQLYNQAVYELLEEKKGVGEAFLFARSATVGGQKFPVHWGGDCWSDYESMAESLRGGLSLQMSGFGYWSHDIGGFENTSTADVYKRWCAFGLLSSHSRLHGSTSYRVPWVYDEEAVDVLRTFTELKAKLMPYIYNISVEASKTGVPTMRSMVLEFQHDRHAHVIDKQYMFGPSLLVAPILNDQSLGQAYLPKGRWTDFFTKEAIEGNTWLEREYDYFTLPLLVRENSILALGNVSNDSEYDYEKGTDFQIYELLDGKTAQTEVYGRDGKLKTTVKALKEGKNISVELKNKESVTLTFINQKVKHSTLKVSYKEGHSIVEVSASDSKEKLTFDLV